MTYATLDDLLARAGLAEMLDVADRDRSGAPDPAVVAAALTHADNIVNGYVAAKYGPLTTVPDLVRTWCVSIARYLLWSNGAPENVRQDYDDAIAALKDVAKGVIVLPVPVGQTAPAPLTGQVMAAHPDEVWTAAKLRGW